MTTPDGAQRSTGLEGVEAPEPHDEVGARDSSGNWPDEVVPETDEGSR